MKLDNLETPALIADLDVLEAERTLYSSQMSLSSRRASQLSAIVQVCVSLGGGW